MFVASLVSGQMNERLALALAGYHALHTTSSWSELENVALSGGNDIIVIDPCFDRAAASETKCVQRIRTVATMRPEVRIVLYLPVTMSAMRTLVATRGERAVSAVVILGVDDAPELLRRNLEGAVCEVLGEQILELSDCLLASLPTTTAQAVRRLFRYPESFSSVKEVAACAHVSRRSLDRQLARWHFTTAAVLLRAAHVVASYERLCESQWPAKKVAADLGYKRYDTFYHDVRSLTGVTPSQLRAALSKTAFVSRITSRLTSRN